MRIFYASDPHGSEKTFKKFLNAGEFYNADVLILGGDLTGKVVVPIMDEQGKWKARFLEVDYSLDENEVAQFERKLRDVGYYSLRTTSEEADRIGNSQAERNELFARLMAARLREWMKVADERLSRTKIQCYIMPGNDDSLAVNSILSESKTVVNPEGKVVKLDGIEMISCGFSNITPWKCPRDIPENELGEKIEAMAQLVKNPAQSIFNFHCPPYATEIDLAPRLDENLRPRVARTGVEMGPAGSTEVRAAIERYQPMLSLHGHIHESRGICKIGRTLCINPGSEYPEGILRGVLVNVEKGRLKSHGFTSG